MRAEMIGGLCYKEPPLPVARGYRSMGKERQARSNQAASDPSLLRASSLAALRKRITHGMLAPDSPQATFHSASLILSGSIGIPEPWATATALWMPVPMC